jgi:hypothetical protein
MYLTNIDEINGDNYYVHQYLKEKFEHANKILFFRNMGFINVLTDIPIDESIDVSEKIDSIKNGDKFIYRLKTVPLVSRKANNKSVKVYPEDLNEWCKKSLLYKMNKHGFSSKHTIENIGLTFAIRKGIKIHYAPILLNGILYVENEEKFKKVLKDGMGRMKFLGMGMIDIFSFDFL